MKTLQQLLHEILADSELMDELNQLYDGGDGSKASLAAIYINTLVNTGRYKVEFDRHGNVMFSSNKM